MKIAFLCVWFAGFLPILLAAIAKWGGVQAGKRYDNHQPRAYLASLEGWPARAQAAQQNGWEAFALFSVGVLMAHQAGVSDAVMDRWALIFVLARILSSLWYVFDRASLRSLCFLMSFYAASHLMFLAITAF